MANTFGRDFRITTFGESHGKGVGVVIDGCPGGMELSLQRIDAALQRRRPGQSEFTTPRKEEDRVICLSGIEGGKTLGSPICLMVENVDIKPRDYDAHIYRPSHADFAAHAKYGTLAASGGGRASARETVARVAAGAVAEQILTQLSGRPPQVVAFVESIKGITAQWSLQSPATRQEVEASLLRCPDPQASEKMMACIREAKEMGDSVGGCIVCMVHEPGIGFGEPVFDKLEADLAKAMLSLPACRGFEVGSGFGSCQMFGSEHNDAFFVKDGKIRTKTNFSGGIQGGISNGEDIYFRAAFKPTSTIARQQQSVDMTGQELILENRGRHDPCVLPRAVPIVEAMTLLVLLDHKLRQLKQVNARC